MEGVEALALTFDLAEEAFLGQGRNVFSARFLLSTARPDRSGLERIMPPSVPGPSAVRAMRQELLEAFGRVFSSRSLS